MAKRVRGSSTRPGQRPPLQRSAVRPATSTTPSTTSETVTPAAAPRPATLTPQEEARAAELEAQIVAEERAATATPHGRRGGTPAPAAAARGTLAIKAADEYAYVVRDVRRIATVGGVLFALLIALYIITIITGIKI